jgi:hypothetical protein
VLRAAAERVVSRGGRTGAMVHVRLLVSDGASLHATRMGGAR